MFSYITFIELKKLYLKMYSKDNTTYTIRRIRPVEWFYRLKPRTCGKNKNVMRHRIQSPVLFKLILFKDRNVHARFFFIQFVQKIVATISCSLDCLEFL